MRLALFQFVEGVIAGGDGQNFSADGPRTADVQWGIPDDQHLLRPQIAPKKTAAALPRDSSNLLSLP